MHRCICFGEFLVLDSLFLSFTQPFFSFTQPFYLKQKSLIEDFFVVLPLPFFYEAQYPVHWFQIL
jgi:hypothetical protein